VAVKIRLKRMGKIRVPQYRIVVADARTKRDGKTIEQVGKYHPKENPSYIEVNSERVQYWLSVGAQPTEPVLAILKRTGDWQKFKGLPPPAKPLQTAPPKPSKRELFEKALREAHSEPEAEAVTQKRGGRGKSKSSEGPTGKVEASRGSEKAAKKSGKDTTDAEAPASEPAPASEADTAADANDAASSEG
jgi:small subunit ribosomal protein S16